jgi:hypothetical protein
MQRSNRAELHGTQKLPRAQTEYGQEADDAEENHGQLSLLGERAGRIQTLARKVQSQAKGDLRGTNFVLVPNDKSICPGDSDLLMEFAIRRSSNRLIPVPLAQTIEILLREKFDPDLVTLQNPEFAIDVNRQVLRGDFKAVISPTMMRWYGRRVVA